MSIEASDVVVRVRLSGGAAFKAEADGVAQSVDTIGAAGKKADLSNLENGAAGAAGTTATLTKKASNLGNTLINLGRALAPASAGLSVLGYYATKTSMAFQKSMMLLVTQANLPRKNLQGLTKDVLALSKVVGQSPLALANGAYSIVSSGVHKNAQIIKDLKTAGVMAAVGNDTVDNTAKALMFVLSTHISKVLSPGRVAAYLEAAIGSGNMHMEDITQSMSSGILPMLKLTGMSFQQILAAAAALTREGVPASQVMSRMRLTLTSMMSPTGAGMKAMADLGLNQFALADDLRRPGGLLTAMQDLSMHAGALRNRNRANSDISAIFGRSRGLANAASLIKALPQMYQIYHTVLTATPKLLQKHFQETKTTQAFKWSQIKAELDAAIIPLGQAIQKYLLPLLPPLVKDLTGVISAFGHLPSGVKKSVVMFGALIVALTPVLFVLGGVLKWFGLIAKLLGMFGTVLGWIARFILVPLGEIILDVIAAVGFATIAIGILVAAVVVVVYIFRKQLWDAIKAVAGFLAGVFMHVWHAVVSVAKDLWGIFKSLGKVVEKVIGFFGHLGGGILHAVTHPLGTIGSLFSHIPFLAEGGNITGSGMAVVGERGPELLSIPRGAQVTPLAGSGMTALKSSLGDSGGINLTSIVQLDGKVIATSVAKVVRNQNNRK